MNSTTEFLLMAGVAILSGLAFCTLIAGTWLAIHRRHEADAAPSFPSRPSVESDLEIPPDREFVEFKETPPPSGEGWNAIAKLDQSHPSHRSHSSHQSHFPHDEAYEFPNPKRF